MMTTASSTSEKTAALEREIRILRKQLEQSEKDRELLEDTKDKNDSLLRKVIRELHSSQNEIAEKSKALENMLEELRSTQSELIESAKMAALGELVAGVAHEVNTPIGIAVTAASHLEYIAANYCENLEQDGNRPDGTERFINGCRESSNMILTNLSRAAELISSFKMVAVDQSFNRVREFNVHAYLNDIILSLSSRLKRRQIEIVIEGDENLTIHTDPGLFAQIITNLILNALIHAFDESDTGKITIRYRSAGENIHMELEDNGKGIEEALLSKIFEPFFTTKRGQGGSGLGLNIVYNIVNGKLQGKIKCNSIPGSGTCFVMEFPLSQMEIPDSLEQVS